MDELLVELFKLDFSSIIIGIFLILSVFIAACEIICKLFKILGKPIKWVNAKDSDHTLLIQTSENLNELQKKHEKDILESARHDEKIELELQNLTKIIIDKPKTRNSVRNIPISNKLHEILKELRKE